jgi:protein-tyrosine phosphatase/membrane-associated phospholipid phosphatase
VGNLLRIARPPEAIVSMPSKFSAAAASAGLSLLFIVVYGGCAWITSHRADVGTWYYSWERCIPFVPWLIIPYMSIDLFFVGGPFLCQSPGELRVLAQRIAFAILVAGAFFLALPLHLAVARPQTSGWTGAIFNFLHSFDQPYNLFPSLHIALQTILVSLYAKHARGIARWALYTWFSLIGVSTLLTYQHHFVDIAGGFVLAMICFYLFREENVRLPVLPNYRVGVYYAAAALIAIWASLAYRPWTGILLWPALAFTLTSAAYFGLGPSIYGKTNGRLPLSTRLMFAPSLLGQHLSLLYYRKRCDAWNPITPHVWIGAQLNRHEASEARKENVTAVLDLTAEFSEISIFRELDYHNIPILDLTAPNLEQLRAAVGFISQRAERGVVYVHCKAGYSRSAAVVGAYLLASGHAVTVEEATGLLRKARPTIVIRPEVLTALDRFQFSLLNK